MILDDKFIQSGRLKMQTKITIKYVKQEKSPLEVCQGDKKLTMIGL